MIPDKLIKARYLPWTVFPDGKNVVFYPQPLLAKKAAVLEVIGDWDQAEDIYRKNLSMARVSGDPCLEAVCCVELGELSEQRSRFDEAMELAKKAEAFYAKWNDEEGWIKSIRLMAKTYLGWADFPKALELLARALEVSERGGNSLRRAEILGNMALTHYWMGNTEKALECAEAERLAVEPLGNIKAMAGVFHTIGRILRESQELAKAQQYLESSLELYRRTGDLRNISLAQGSLAGVHYYNGHFDEALSMFHSQVRIASKLGEKYIQACAYGDISSVYFETGDLDAARRYSLLELELSTETGDKSGISHSSYRLGLIEERAGNISEAERLYDQAIEHGRRIESGRFLPDCLMAKADFLYRTGKASAAGEALLEARQRANDYNRQDILEKCRALDLLLSYPGKPEQSEKGLMEIAGAQPEDNDFRASIYYHLWKCSGKEDHRLLALEIHRKLVEMKDCLEYRKIIEELEAA